jgi:very-short-patch-repair endonuclease
MRHKPTFYERMFAEKSDRWRITYLPQWIVGPFIADFYLPAYRTIVEIDGSHHYRKHGLERDAKRSQYFVERDFKVVRIPNPEVMELKRIDLISQLTEDFQPEPVDRTFHQAYFTAFP